MRPLSILGGLFLPLLLSGCSWWWSSPPPEDILVSTAPPGAACVLTRRGRPIGRAAPTPAIALVAPGTAAITVTCRRRGFAAATVTLSTEPTGSSSYPSRVDVALIPAPR